MILTVKPANPKPNHNSTGNVIPNPYPIPNHLHDVTLRQLQMHYYTISYYTSGTPKLHCS